MSSEEFGSLLIDDTAALTMSNHARTAEKCKKTSVLAQRTIRKLETTGSECRELIAVPEEIEARNNKYCTSKL